MKKLFLFSIVTILAFSNCSSDDETSNNLPEGLKWRYILETNDPDSGSPLYDPIIDGDIIILPRRRNDDRKGELIALNKHTGEFIWNWTEAFDKYGINGFSVTSYVHDGILAIGDNSYTAAINIETGETIWENKESIWGLTAMNGINEQIFKTAYIPNEKFWIQKANIYNGEWETIHELDKEAGFNLDSYSPSAVEWEGKTYLAFHDINWRNLNGAHEVHYFLNFYNVTDDYLAWRSDTIPINSFLSHTPGVFPVFEQGQILLSNESIYSYSMSDGSLKWKNTYTNNFTLTSRLAADNGRIYGNSGDGYFLCLDVHNGEEYFRTTTGGSPSRIIIHDGKCFMSAVSTYTHSQLMVIDANNGNVIEAIRSPFDDIDKDAVLDFNLAVDKETGYAYTSDFKNFLCYDFE